MSRRLEEFVPSRELCKQIPEGYFQDSILVWAHFPGWEVEWEVLERSSVDLDRETIPAPTLQEIMDLLVSVHPDVVFVGGGAWEINNGDRLFIGFDSTHIAMQMWLSIYKEEENG